MMQHIQVNRHIAAVSFHSHSAQHIYPVYRIIPHITAMDGGGSKQKSVLRFARLAGQ